VTPSREPLPSAPPPTRSVRAAEVLLNLAAAVTLAVTVAACSKRVSSDKPPPAPRALPPQAVSAVPLASGARNTTIATQASPWSIGVDADAVCFANMRDDSIYVVSKQGGPITRVGGATSHLGDVACGGGDVYWATMGKVYRAPAAGGARSGRRDRAASLAASSSSPRTRRRRW
jgi:hypothetical protein